MSELPSGPAYVSPELFDPTGLPEVFRRVLDDDGIWILRRCTESGWREDNLEAMDRDGRTPLMVAAWYAKRGALKALLEVKANLEAKDLAGKTGYEYVRDVGEGARQQYHYLSGKAVFLEGTAKQIANPPSLRRPPDLSED